MRTVELRRVLDHKQLRAELAGQRVPELPATVTDETMITDAATGEPVALYLPVGSCPDLRWAARSARRATVFRSGQGYRSTTSTFGQAPRRPTIQREGCRSSRMRRDQPRQHAVLEAWAARLQATLAELLPVAVDESVAEASAILPEWRLRADTLWTSGVINDTVAMPYHTDRANFDVWSAMPVLRRGITGGHLHLADYNAVIECRDGWCVWWPGYRIVHGVTPITRREADGYRVTVVYYALRGMKDCATSALETQRAREKRTERERRAAATLAERDT